MVIIFRELELPKQLLKHGWYVATVDGGDFADYLHHDATLHSSTGGILNATGGWFNTEDEALQARQDYYDKWSVTTTSTDSNAFDRAMKGV